MADSGRMTSTPSTDPIQRCPDCTYGEVLGIDDYMPCPTCGGGFSHDPGAVPTSENHYGDGPHDEPQDQR